jgi:hypothetical protein
MDHQEKIYSADEIQGEMSMFMTHGHGTIRVVHEAQTEAAQP